MKDSQAGLSKDIQIIEVGNKRELLDFIRFPLSLYKNDPFYSPQLTHDLKSHFTSKNPFFDEAEVSFFLAYKDGRLAGRIASIVNHVHIRVQNEHAGFFGFFECINDREVAASLLDTVRLRLKGKGLSVMRGPMNFSVNEECGFLIEGFDEPPMLMTPYNPPYYNGLMAEYGLVKAKDLHAYVHDVKPELPEKIMRVAAIAEKKGITARQVTKDNFMQVMRDFREIYNVAWEHNWSFIPMSGRELEYSSEQIKPIAVHDLIVVAEKDGEPVGIIGMVPDFNVVLRNMKGRLNPVTIIKALYYSRKIPDLRMMILGIKPEYRNKGVDAVLFREGFKGVRRGKYKRVEFSWILEDNINVIRQIEMIGSRLYKIYRIYEKQI
jgi:GNAT superfamily N-acetyltransferase